MISSTKDNFCAPGREKNNQEEGTCFTKNELNKIAEKYNDHNGGDKINTQKESKELHKEIKQKLKPKCDKDYCLKENEYVKKAIDTEEVFRPERNQQWEENPKQWLNTNEIDNVLSQYQDKYKNFEFIGPTPLDFNTVIGENEGKKECVLNDLCQFDMEELIKKGKTKIGIVFNTDVHTGSGKHWISAFIDFEEGQIYFFDSATSVANNSNEDNGNISELKDGESFKKQYEAISNLLHNIKQQGNQIVTQKKYPNIKKQFRIFYNTQKHQKEDSECGMFSIYFIVKMLEGISFEDLNKQRITDDDVFQFRYVFFHPNEQTNIQDLPKKEEPLIEEKNTDDEEDDGEDYTIMIHPETNKVMSIFDDEAKKVLKNMF